MRRGLGLNPPVRVKQTHDDFYYDGQVTSAIRTIFGEDVLAHVQGLIHGDWLLRMRDSILVKIFSQLDLSDIFRLTPVCRRFRTICNSNTLWKAIYEMNCSKVTPDIIALGEEKGWKKVFFTNKIQVQKEVFRKKSEVRDEKEMDDLIKRLNNQSISLSEEVPFLDELSIRC